MSLYKEGDIVTIVSEETIKTFRETGFGVGWVSPEGLYIDPAMLHYCDKSYTVDRVLHDELGVRYVLKKASWAWSDSCFKETVDPSYFDGMEELL